MRKISRFFLLAVIFALPQTAAMAVISLANTPKEYIDRADEIFAAADIALADLLASQGQTNFPIQIEYDVETDDHKAQPDGVLEYSNRIIRETEEKCVRTNLRLIGSAPNELDTVYPVVIYVYSDCQGLGAVSSRHLWLQLDEGLQPIGALVQENVQFGVADSASEPAQ